MRLVVVNVFAGPIIRQTIWSRLAQHTGWEIHLIVGENWIDDYGNHVAFERQPGSAVVIHPFSVKFAGNIPLHFWPNDVLDLIRKIKPDLTYIYSEPYALATIFLSLRLSSRLTIGFHTAQNIVKRYPLPFRLGQKAVLKRASYATAVSDEVAAGLRQKGFYGPIGFHTFGLQDNWFAPLAQIGDRAGLRLAFVGRLTDEKGVLCLLDAVEAAGDAVAELRLFGDGQDRRAYESRVSRSPSLSAKVYFAGFVASADIRAAYDWADAIAVPSETTLKWKEQFGRVVIEAGARGCYPIVSSSGELPHLVGHLGFGRSTPERDSKKLTLVLRDVAAQLSSIRARRNFYSQRVRELFSEDAISEELASFFGPLSRAEN